jgi:hypothetical protein
MRRQSLALLPLFAVLALGCGDSPTTPPGIDATRGGVPAKAGPRKVVKFATFNASLNRNFPDQLMSDMASGTDTQAQAVAEIIQRTRPDVLLVNEFDFDAGGVSMQGFQDNYLSVPQNFSGQGPTQPIVYPFRYSAPSNTGIHSGFDLDRSGTVVDNPGPFRFDHAGDAFGFGTFEGQFGMAVYSMYPIDVATIRTFQLFVWADMPGANLPVDPGTGMSFYTDEELEVFRLSSKSHWDLPIQIGNKVVHFLVSHPTPPVFDGPEDRNGTRNNDEIRFWADYVIPSRSGYIYDDNGMYGGLTGELFVIAGDQNADPFDGDSFPGAAQQLLDHPLINTKATPASAGGVEMAGQGPPNDTHVGDPAFDTADFSEAAFGGPGNLRADYVLPRRELSIRDSGIFWPTSSDPLFPLTGPGFPAVSSDHRLVWIDVQVPGS